MTGRRHVERPKHEWEQFSRNWSRDSVVGKATRYSLSGSEFEPKWGQKNFSSPHPSSLAMGPTQPPL
jgi:hypothetical protein